ncbi:MAG TPA: 2Fe-2S iron-sulfur cluster-binding protein [Candidatus Thermoplasmatota archaeon]|nr:2Fe-2S iron-sulfur cluster-binding protein [Candidatus Thermoplasmatota archaeon]
MSWITHNGRRVPAKPDDTVASALYRAGVRVFSRSVKLHRPRGLYCGVGKCGQCMMRIGGAPSVRACMTPVREGLSVEDQNCWPSARWDVYGLLRFTPRSFDPQRAGIGLPQARPLFHAIVRRMAGWGTVPDPIEPQQVGAVERRDVDLLVVGSGPSGLSAAISAAQAGARVLVLEENPRLGGRLARERGDLAARLLARARSLGVELHARATVAGIYPEGDVAAVFPDRLVRLRPRRIVLATGAPEAGDRFPNNDLPGVMSLSCALELASRDVAPGRRIVVVGDDERGVTLKVLLDGRAKVTLLPEARVLRARGFSRLRSIVVSDGGRKRRVRADVLCVAATRRPAIELAQQAGASLVERHGALVPATDADGRCAPGVFACGDLVAPGGIEAAMVSGERVGAAAARSGSQLSADPPLRTGVAAHV